MENYFDEEVSEMPGQQEIFSLRGPLEEYSVYKNFNLFDGIIRDGIILTEY